MSVNNSRLGQVEEEPVRHHVAGVPPQIRNKPITNKMGTVPPLKLNLLRRPDSAGGYHVTPGLDSSRSVMSWGDDSYRPSQVTRPPPKVSKPSRVEKIADSKNSSEKKDDSDNVENEKINSHTDRVGMLAGVLEMLIYSFDNMLCCIFMLP